MTYFNSKLKASECLLSFTYLMQHMFQTLKSIQKESRLDNINVIVMFPVSNKISLLNLKKICRCFLKFLGERLYPVVRTNCYALLLVDIYFT